MVLHIKLYYFFIYCVNWRRTSYHDSENRECKIYKNNIQVINYYLRASNNKGPCFMVTNQKRLFSNFFSLGIIQGTNYLLPILITPYVIKRIGADGFGIIAVTQVVMMFFQTISDYGFSLTATRDVSRNRETRTVLSRIFYTVLIMYVSLFVRLVFVALVLIFIRSKPDYIYFLFFTGVGNVLAGSVSIILAIRMLRLKRVMPSRKKFWPIRVRCSLETADPDASRYPTRQ